MFAGDTRLATRFSIAFLAGFVCLAARAQDASPPTLQQLVDTHAGRALLIADTFEIDAPLRIATSGTTLYGPGRIVQRNPASSIIELEGVSDVRIEDLTLARPVDGPDSTANGIVARDCSDIDFLNLRVLDNRSQSGTIALDKCRRSVVRGCRVINYKRIGVDDRTTSPLYGYAFRVIDGTGIFVTFSEGIQIIDNQVVERRLFPTQETKDAHQLGQFTDGAAPLNRGRLAPKGDYANNWHQGSAIVVTSPTDTNHVLVSGNYIENAAQGIDMHADNVTCSNNVINYAFIGIKCMHGARNVVIANNNVSHMDLWGLVMLPGTLSHPAEEATADHPQRTSNFTSGNIIANNVFSHFGLGYERFNWSGQKSGVISLESGQLAENPIMTDIIIEGNVVYDTSSDGRLEGDQIVAEGPRYEYAVYITPEPSPRGLLFRDNVFHPGRGGVANVELPEGWGQTRTDRGDAPQSE